MRTRHKTAKQGRRRRKLILYDEFNEGSDTVMSSHNADHDLSGTSYVHLTSTPEVGTSGYAGGQTAWTFNEVTKDVGVSDFFWRARISNSWGGSSVGLIWRFVDSDNLMMMRFLADSSTPNKSDFEVWERVAGSWNSLHDEVMATWLTTWTVEVTTEGRDCKVEAFEPDVKYTWEGELDAALDGATSIGWRNQHHRDKNRHYHWRLWSL